MSRPARRPLAICVAAALITCLLFGVSTAGAATFTVNSTADSNDGACTTADCTLREAMEQSNAATGADTIDFALPGTGPWTIRPTSALPVITDGVTIDALPNCTGAHQVVIDGSNAGDVDGLQIASGSGTLVRGIVIGGFDTPGRAAARFTGGASVDRLNNSIECSYLGTDATGTAPNPNWNGVIFAAQSNRVTRQSLLSGNLGYGAIFERSPGGNSISESFIGTNAAGSGPLPNGIDGVADSQPGGERSKVIGSVISANGGDGVRTFGHVTVSDNRIGTNAAGHAPLPNGDSGVEVGQGSDGAEISSNLISGNTGVGIWLRADSHASSIRSNRIGTDLAGNVAVPNGTGILVNGYQNRIHLNTISGNGRGIEIRNDPLALAQPNAYGNSVWSNKIGTTIVGSSAISNAAEGIYIAAPNSAIGARGPNTIAHNGGAGIAIEFGFDNRIAGNSFHSNGGLGIDLLPSGPTANDPGDADGGPNRRQNFPVITRAEAGDGQTLVEGTLDSAPTTTYSLSFYRSSACDPSGFGEGSGQFTPASVTTDSSGHADFRLNHPGVLPVGDEVTATATDPTGSTSEFSECTGVTQGPLPPQLTFTVNSTDDTNDGFCTTAHCSLREAIERANSRPGVDTITFGGATPGPWTIRPTSALPQITDGAIIEALPNCVGSRQIIIDGSLAGDADGLRIASGSGTVVRGLVIGGFDSPGRAGVRFTAGVSADTTNRVECSYLGTNAAGTAPNPNTYGVVFAARTNVVERQSVLSGNLQDGALFTAGANASRIFQSFVGTNALGTGPLPNGRDGAHDDGVLTSSTAQSATVFASTVAANAGDGIETAGGISVVSSKVGTNADGAAALANGESGVEVRPGFRGATVSNNQISGHAGAGVLLRGDSNGSTVSDNLIGTNAAGSAAIPNGTGILVNGFQNSIARNVISGNGRGIEIRNDASALQMNAYGNSVYENWIGTTDFLSALPNQTEGLYIAAPTAAIGVKGSNLIAHNGGAGVAIEFGWDNRIVGNSIHSNGGLGIDLLPAGPTPNDAGDADGGPNDLQNFSWWLRCSLGAKPSPRSGPRSIMRRTTAGRRTSIRS
jgi:CSLREA domain-containing protein